MLGKTRDMSCTHFQKFVVRMMLGAALMCAASAPSAAQIAPSRPSDATAEDIVVVARRSGVPVWRVTGPQTTVVLVGSIGSVAPGTQWDPASLDSALAKADRIMFPEALSVNLGLFSLISTIGKWRAQASLPAGQTLQSMATPEQWARLVALRDRGILKPGFERTHPYHLASTLNALVRGERKRLPGADAYVRRFVRKNPSKQVPLAAASVKEITAEFFASDPHTHMKCLMDAVTLVEAGQPGVQARANAFAMRSVAWAARRVPDALAAKMDDGRRACWPEGGRFEAARAASLRPTVRALMTRSEVTLAVLSLDSLAEPGGILDDLVAAGFDVSGPRWRN
jgi:uncharacterized protein YbaP (TraB family)